MRTGILIALLALAACDAQQATPDASSRSLLHEGRVLSGEDGVAWLLNSAGLFRYDSRASHRLEVKLPGWEWVSEPFACLPDLARGPAGELVITSNIVPKLWRLDPKTLAVTVHALELDADNDKEVGFAGLVYSPLSPAYFAVSQLHGSLWMIDPSLKRASKIALEDLADSSVEVETAFIRAACPSTAPLS